MEEGFPIGTPPLPKYHNPTKVGHRTANELATIHPGFIAVSSYGVIRARGGKANITLEKRQFAIDAR